MACLVSLAVTAPRRCLGIVLALGVANGIVVPALKLSIDLFFSLCTMGVLSLAAQASGDRRSRE